MQLATHVHLHGLNLLLNMVNRLVAMYWWWWRAVSSSVTHSVEQVSADLVVGVCGKEL